jgi:glyoxylase-like metal-dependent hydrolase (beta-lactamase superfamily II)
LFFDCIHRNWFGKTRIKKETVRKVRKSRANLMAVFFGVCFLMIGCRTGRDEVYKIMSADSAVTFQLGQFECTVIKDGETQVNAFEFFSGVDSEKINASFREYGLNPESVPLSLQVLLINTGEYLVLIDTGLGEPVYSDEGRLFVSLNDLGIAPEDIDVVIITHGHWDHIGGITDEEGLLHFPNARHVMSRTAWEFWTNEENLTGMSEQLTKWARANLPPLRGRVELVEAGSDILSGISMIAAPGHTPGQMAVLVRSGDRGLLCVADAAHNPVQMAYPDIGYAHDMDRELAKTTRRVLVEQSLNDRFLVYGCHFPFPGLGYVEEIENKRVWRGLEMDR